MKKTFNQLKVILSFIVVLALFLGCGALTYQEAKSVIIDFRDKHSVISDLHTDIRDYHHYGEKIDDDIFSESFNPDSKKGISILPAFYLAHKENHYDSGDAGFYSMLQNSKGESVAEYQQSYILFEKNTNDKRKDDVRVLILGDEFEEKFSFSGESANYNIEACRTLCGVKDYGEKTASWDNIGDSLKVKGTCDDHMVYLENLTWCDTINARTYTYSPEENQTHKGTVEFKDWFDYKKDNSDIYVPHDIWYRAHSNPEYRQDAEEICEQNLTNYKNNRALGDNWSENLFTSFISETSIIHAADSDDVYIFTTAYVIHPLKTAVQRLVTFYLIALAVAVILIVFINVLFDKKRKFLEKSYTPIEENNNETDKLNRNSEENESNSDKLKEG